MKNILIITYYWPPLAGGGVQRWLKFAKYLPTYGWRPIVFTPEQPDFNLEDTGLALDSDVGIEVVRFPIWEPFNLYKRGDSSSGAKNEQGVISNSGKGLFGSFKNWIRGNIILPDPKVFWVRPSTKFLADFIKERKIEVVVTTGPPHSMHLIGLRLKKKLNLKWIADFRDPWSRWDMLSNFNTGSRARTKLRKWESRVFESADEVITVSESWASVFNSDHGRETRVITNGYDEEDFQDPCVVEDDSFVISHSGLINNFRDPVSFFEAVKELCNEDQEFSNQLRLEFCGVVDKEILSRIQNDKILAAKFIFRGYQNHSEVIRLNTRSNLLLLLTNQSENTKGHLPGKLFEYFAANRFILALGDRTGDAANLISRTSSGKMLDYDDKEGIKSLVKDKFKSSTTFDNNREEVEFFSRKELTKKLALILDQMV